MYILRINRYPHSGFSFCSYLYDLSVLFNTFAFMYACVWCFIYCMYICIHNIIIYNVSVYFCCLFLCCFVFVGNHKRYCLSRLTQVHTLCDRITFVRNLLEDELALIREREKKKSENEKITQNRLFNRSFSIYNAKCLLSLPLSLRRTFFFREKCQIRVCVLKRIIKSK